jgi:hypothetical protein
MVLATTNFELVRDTVTRIERSMSGQYGLLPSNQDIRNAATFLRQHLQSELPSSPVDAIISGEPIVISRELAQDLRTMFDTLEKRSIADNLLRRQLSNIPNQIPEGINIHIFFFAWFVYGAVTGICMSQGYLLEYGQFAHEYFGKYIPSVNRIDKLTKIDVTLAKSHASVMFMSMPLLFIGFLFCSVEESIAGVRRNGKETLVFALLVVIASGVFVSGLGHSLGERSFFAFSMLATLLTGLCAYIYRVAYCIATKR